MAKNRTATSAEDVTLAAERAQIVAKQEALKKKAQEEAQKRREAERQREEQRQRKVAENEQRRAKMQSPSNTPSTWSLARHRTSQDQQTRSGPRIRLYESRESDRGRQQDQHGENRRWNNVSRREPQSGYEPSAHDPKDSGQSRSSVQATLDSQLQQRINQHRGNSRRFVGFDQAAWDVAANGDAESQGPQPHHIATQSAEARPQPNAEDGAEIQPPSIGRGPRLSSRFDTELVADPGSAERSARNDNDGGFKRRGKRDDRRGRVLSERDMIDSSRDYDDIDGDGTGRRSRKKAEKKKNRAQAAPTPISLPPFISVQNLATALKQRPEDFLEKLEDLGFEGAAMEHVLTAEDAGLVAVEFNYEPVVEQEQSRDLEARPLPADKSTLPERPPVITIMGHVDHGKTTILDYLRKSSVAATEHGGITQHIGAFVVPMASGKPVTFLDTPGHAAFLSMRERGANVTDIVILVVAADDSVKPQTIEAIRHAKNANVPIIVAINKIDKEGADVSKVKQDLMVNGIEVEDFGGDIQAVEVSGKTGQGMDELEEAAVAQAELLDLRAEKDGSVEGWVLEASTKDRGRVATVLVRRGTLSVGDIIVAGQTWARVRSLRNEASVMLPSAGPGTPVEVDGWREQPMAGDEVLQADGEGQANSVVDYRKSVTEREQAAVDMEAINANRRLDAERREQEKFDARAGDAAQRVGDVADGDDAFASPVAASEAANDKHTELVFIIKADVSGSTEAIAYALSSIPLANHPVSLNILRTGVGALSEFDIDQISTVPRGHGFLVNFNQDVLPHVSTQAERAGIPIIGENIIYKVIDAVRARIEDHLPPLVSSRVLGELDISQTFDIRVGKKLHKVAGCRVKNGAVARTSRVRVYRGNVADRDSLVFDGALSSLRSHKKDVEEMRKGTECGLGFEGWEGFAAGDAVQVYEEIRERRRLA